MAEYSVTVGIGFPSEFERAVALAIEDAAALFPNQVSAIAALAEAGHARWLEYASGERALPSGATIRPWSGAYLRSIQMEQTADLRYTLWSDDPKARTIEEGAPAWDFHEVLATSRKVRRSRRGTLYLIIPFRHGTPDTVVVGEYSQRMMPQDVYDRMREKAASYITGHYSELSVHDPSEPVRRNTYDWGGRLTLAELSRMGFARGDPKTQRMAGMVRFGTDLPGRSGSLYLTFRTLSESNGEGTWVIREREGRYPAKAVAEWLNQKYPEIMDAALELDAEHVKRLAGIQ